MKRKGRSLKNKRRRQGARPRLIRRNLNLEVRRTLRRKRSMTSELKVRRTPMRKRTTNLKTRTQTATQKTKSA